MKDKKRLKIASKHMAKSFCSLEKLKNIGTKERNFIAELKAAVNVMVSAMGTALDPALPKEPIKTGARKSK